MMKFFFGSLIALLASHATFAQITQNIAPQSFDLPAEAFAREAKKQFVLPDLNVEQEMSKAQQALANCHDCTRNFYGKPLPVDIDLTRDGQITKTAAGTVWTLTVTSATAKGFQFYFSHYEMPLGATLHIYSEDKDIVLGAFTDKNIKPDKRFSTRIFPKKTAILEYFEPNNAAIPGVLRLDKITHVFRDLMAPASERTGDGFSDSGNCNIDVNCSSGSGLSDVKKAVAMFTYIDPETNMNKSCTGFLINSSAAAAAKPAYFMTAHHCLMGTTVGQHYPDYTFYFNYENTGCQDDIQNPILKAATFQGAYLRTFGDKTINTDYALLEMSDRPQLYTSVAFLGWDKGTLLPPGQTVNISHPNGDVKKIAIDDEAPVRKSLLTAPCFAPLNMEVWETSWNQGTTEPGSSGSPLLNGLERVIGVFHGGNSRCSDSPGKDFCEQTMALPGPDWFPRMDYIWTHTNHGNTPVSTFLDPANAFSIGMDGFFPTTPTGVLRINTIMLSSNRWEEGPKLIPQISNSADVGALTYSWSPAADIFNPKEAVAILYFGGKKPTLPLTKTYTLTVTASNGMTTSGSIQVTLYDCETPKLFDISVCPGRPQTIGRAAVAQETYSWSPATYLSDPTVSDPVLTIPEAGNSVYTCTITTPICTKTATYRVVASNPAPFYARRVAEKKFGGSKNDQGKGIKIFSNRLCIYGYSEHAANGDHVGEIRETESLVNEFMLIYTDFNLDKINNYSAGQPYADLYHYMDVRENTGAFLKESGTIRKVDLEGKMLWQKDNILNSALAVVATAEGGMLMIVGSYNGSGQANGNTILTLDAAGTELISQRVTVSCRISSLLRTDDKQYFVLGSRYVVGSPGLVQKIKNNQTVWTYNLPNDQYAPFFYHSKYLTLTNDGGVAFLSVTYTYDDGDHVTITKLSANGGVEWSRTITKPSTGSVIKQTLDGGFIVGGSNTVYKLDSYGNVQGEKTFNGGDRIQDIVQLDAKTYYFVGTAPDQDESIWAVKFVDDVNFPDPDATSVCESVPATFNNSASPFEAETIAIGGCGTDLTVPAGAVFHVTAEHSVVVKPNTILKSGSTVSIKVEAPVIPCSTGTNGRLADTDAEIELPETIAPADLRIVPNPARQTCYLYVQEPTGGPVQITVFNAVGQPMIDQAVSQGFRTSYELDIRDLSPGVFLVRFRSGQRTLVGKLLIR